MPQLPSLQEKSLVRFGEPGMKHRYLRDTLFAHPQEAIGDFVFDERVVSVFSDMIRRSVPGYVEVLKMTGWLATEYAMPASRIYDLGCSLGDSTFAIVQALPDWVGDLVAVDKAPAMVDACRDRLTKAGLAERVVLRCEDIRDTRIENASFVTLNYTLQFIPPEERSALIEALYGGLRSGGALLISEKIAFEDAAEQNRMIALHHAFKRANGYSDLEISQKRTSLENILIPETLSVHRLRLRNTGFSTVDVWHRCLNFASLLAVK